MVPLICIYTGGVLTLFMALLHTKFYKMFNWKKEFAKISLENSRILYTIHIALLLDALIIGILTVGYAKELSQSTGLAAGFNFLISIFWLWRFIWEFIYFKVEKGQKFPARSIVVSVIFILLFASYFVPFLFHILA